MSCQKCGFCEEDLTTLENISVDARSRGNYRIATMLDQALERCDVLHKKLQPNNREYLKNVSRMVKEHPASNVCANILRDAKHVVETTKERQSSEPTRRGMGFSAMVEAARRGTFEEFNPQPETYDRDSERPIPSGFRAMLDSISPNKTRETLEERPHVRRGMGFAAMLEGARRGTE
jgi:hypothetical protein